MCMAPMYGAHAGAAGLVPTGQGLAVTPRPAFLHSERVARGVVGIGWTRPVLISGLQTVLTTSPVACTC